MLLNDRRVTVRIYVPPDYEWNERTYPVLYMFDGHNLFDVRTSTYNQEWRIDETMAEISAGPQQPAVVVGIDAPEDRLARFAMYSIGEWDYRKTPHGRRLGHVVGTGDQTSAFLFEVVKPYVEANYRVSTNREGVGVAGSSMGGYMSLYSAATYPELISKVLAFSPVVLDHPMAGYLLRDYLVAQAAPQPQRIYLDMGDAEELEYIDSPVDLVRNLEALELALRSAGHREVVARIIPGGTHSERSWAARFAEVYLWAFTGSHLPSASQP